MNRALTLATKTAGTPAATPFLKWAGGKGQLLPQLLGRLPSSLSDGRITKYVEPFLGGGAVYFALQGRPGFSKSLLADVNRDLVLTYGAIRDDVRKVISSLAKLSDQYLSSADVQRESFFYEVRDEFNAERGTIDSAAMRSDGHKRAAQLIFLNRTCYNGLYRVNSKGQFNVPYGRYRNPVICHTANLMAVSDALANTAIVESDFEQIAHHIDNRTFVYFDPPYRPLNATSSFTSYASGSFDDNDQRRLAGFYRSMSARGAKLMLSNSDPMNNGEQDRFFDELYSGFTITRVQATRMINSKSSGRGKISEILVTNF